MEVLVAPGWRVDVGAGIICGAGETLCLVDPDDIAGLLSLGAVYAPGKLPCAGSSTGGFAAALGMVGLILAERGLSSHRN